METMRHFWSQISESLIAAFSHPTYGWMAAWGTVLLLAWLANYLTRRVVLRVVRAVIDRSKVQWDDALIEHKVFHRLSHLAPAIVFYMSASWLFPGEDQEVFRHMEERLATAWMYIASARAIAALLDATVTIGMSKPATRGKPLRSYAQVVKLLLWMTIIILVVASLIDRSPWGLLTGLGAMTAIILLVFKDTILSFVASIQIASYDMVRTGDWIEMPKFGADGDVIDISLNTIKVQNWDKTITTIPTYAMVTESFRNWRGMTESGGRRIKRSIAIDMSSIRFLNEADIEHLHSVKTIRDYMNRKEEEVAKWNQENDVADAPAADARKLTNVGTFRAYIEHYLKRNPEIRKDMTFLVRQLAPTAQGLPMEIYVFCADQRWSYYESIMADIFDHLLAVMSDFGLRVFQAPSGADIHQLAKA